MNPTAAAAVKTLYDSPRQGRSTWQAAWGVEGLNSATAHPKHSEMQPKTFKSSLRSLFPEGIVLK